MSEVLLLLGFTIAGSPGRNRSSQMADGWTDSRTQHHV